MIILKVIENQGFILSLEDAFSEKPQGCQIDTSPSPTLCLFKIKKELDWKPIYNKKFLKTKIMSYGHETTDFHDDEIPKVDENYYLQVLLKECKYTEKEKKVIRHITDDLRNSFDSNEADEE